MPADVKEFATVFAYLKKEGYYQETKGGVQCVVRCGRFNSSQFYSRAFSGRVKHRREILKGETNSEHLGEQSYSRLKRC